MTTRNTAALATVVPIKKPGGQPPAAALRHLAGRYDGPPDIEGQMKLAAALAAAHGAVPPMYRGSPGDVLATIYQARALDVAVAVALQHFHYNDLTGKGGMSGSLMWALIVRAGHTIHIIGEPDDRAVEMELVRCDRQPGGRVSWTIGEAAAAKLTSRETWERYPADLLYWRCVSRLARRFASDVVQGLGYVPEELASMTDDDVDEERPVDPDIQQLLADLDTHTIEQINALRRRVARQGLGDRYAGTIEGRPVTVNAVIAVRAERLLTAAALAVEDTAPPAPAATPGRALACGCDAARVIATGDHLDGCSDAQGPPAPAPVEAPAAVWRCCRAPAGGDHADGCRLPEFEQAWQPLTMWPPTESDD